MKGQGRILIAVTSHDALGSTGKKTGYWLGEVTHFVEAMWARRGDIDFVSPKGGRPPMDEKSRAPQDPANQAFLGDTALLSRLDASMRPDEVDASRYDAIYYAGGHGTMWDFPDDAGLSRIAASIYERGGVVAAVCHGPTGLLNVRLSDGRLLVEGKRVTGFANLEEGMVRLRKVVPFLLQDALQERGGRYAKARLPFCAHVEEDERLVTGQNPQSARAVGERVAALLAARAA